MNRYIPRILAVLALVPPLSLCADRPQDNWYLESNWSRTSAATNGGLAAPVGIAVGMDGSIFVADDGNDCIQVYAPGGDFSYAITNTFGAGESFSAPRGMITDREGKLYVADYGRNAVFVFSPTGSFLRKVGGIPGAATGQLSGVMDVAVSVTGEIFVLEQGNARISVFTTNGVFSRFISGPGTLDSLLQNPTSIAVSPDNRVYVASTGLPHTQVGIKAFTTEGQFLQRWNWREERDFNSAHRLYLGPTSIRVDVAGLITTLFAIYHWDGGSQAYLNALDPSSYMRVFTSDGTIIGDYYYRFADYNGSVATSACHAVGADGSFVVDNKNTRQVLFYRRALRDQWAPPRNSIPAPNTTKIQQRPNSGIVDIDFQVNDADDTNVTAGALVFKGGVQAISNCLRNLALVEGTATNLGRGIAANVPHRITWNAGADWGVSLADYRVAILAQDSRTNLLDIHYLHLPAGNSMPALTISRSPLTSNDYMQVWWWLLATNDTAIGLSTNRIIGVGGPYDAQILCDGGFTTLGGRNFLHARMNVREATPAEIAWARQAALPGNTNRFTAVSVGGRPIAVNEYGFDTGDWGTNAFWVVPLN